MPGVTDVADLNGNISYFDSQKDKRCEIALNGHDDDESQCLTSKKGENGVISESGANCNGEDKKCSSDRGSYKFVKLGNTLSGGVNVDTLHTKSSNFKDSSSCTEERCLGSIVFPPDINDINAKDDITSEAEEFINEYYTYIKKADTTAHKKRLQEVIESLKQTGEYTLTEEELTFGAKTAWRNAPRCIGRIQWTRLQVFDYRNVSTAEEMFEALCNHLSYATNGGNIRSVITIFPRRRKNEGDFRIWNHQLVSYAAYKQEDGSYIGDPMHADFTQVCQRLGWKGKGGTHDVLPLVLQARGEEPKMFEIPKHLILEVTLEHPRYKWFKDDINFKWYTVAAISSMLLDIGGNQFTSIPFNGWYMGTEVGRDMCDSNRYNMAPVIAKHLGFDTSTNSNMWKDHALLEANVAVLHTFRKHNVTVVDHHTASETFMKHMAKEQGLRRGCPADWVWLVPPMSASSTPLFHQEMLNYKLKPSMDYQPAAWVNYEWKDVIAKQTRKRSFKAVATIVRFFARLMIKAMESRTKVTILYGTETGMSETYANTLQGIFDNVFCAKVMGMDEYDVTNLENESLLLIVTSTFGHGDAPENGETFGRYLMNTTHGTDETETSTHDIGQRFDGSTPERSTPPSGTLNELVANNAGILKNVRFSVFALGSKAYPNFCAFGRTLDVLLGELGGERITSCGLGDELSGQEESFQEWAMEVFKTACGVFGIEEGIDLTKANAQLIQDDKSWAVDRFRITEDKQSEHDLCSGLSQVHKKTVFPTIMKKRRNLQPVKNDEPRTIVVEIDTQDEEQLLHSPGDHVCICPANEKELVDRILERVDMDISPDAVVKCEFLDKTSTDTMKLWNASSRLPPCSLRDALTRYLDITSPPSQHFLHMLSTQATEESEQNELLTLSKKLENYEEWKFEDCPNLAEVLDQFPSIKLSPSFLLTEVPILKPRYYSISSSLKMYQCQIHMTLGVISYRVGKYNKGPQHNGVCSAYLNRIDVGEIVPAFVRRAPLFSLPQENDRPVIMVGPGTGIAPFRSFWQERLIDTQRKTFSSMTLVHGCRKNVPENIYNVEIEAAKQQGALTDAWIALSRESNVPKTYVQDILRQKSAEVFRQIYECNGHFYVCGDINMAAAVEKTLEEIISSEGRITPQKAKTYLSHMRNTNTYHEDIFGDIWRTRSEVLPEVRKQNLINED